MKTLLFFGVLGLAGFLLLLVLLDVRSSERSRVSQENGGQPALEMPVVLLPIEPAVSEPEPATGEPQPMREEKALANRDEPPATRPRPMEKTAPGREVPGTEPPADDGEAAGRFPALVANYAGSDGLEAHLAALRGLGARMFVADMDEQRLVAEVDPSSWSLSKEFPPLSGMALDRSRLINDDRSVEAIVARARSLYGHGNFVFVLLMPQAVENRILRGLNDAFQGIGRPPSDFVSVHGSYAHRGRRLLLSVVDARDQQGDSVPLSAEILLGP